MSEPLTPVTSPAIREPHYERVGLAGLGASGGVLAINSMAEAVSVAQLMAKSGIAIRKHLRDQPGACLGVLMQALRWEMDPYMVGNKSYAVNDQLAYEAQLIAAVVLTRAAIIDEPDYEYEGADATRTCTVTFKMRSGKHLSYTTPEFGKITTKNSPLWKSDPDQQLGYFAVRSWARRHQPHVLLGVYTVEEAHEVIDVTPGTSGVASRLPGAQNGNGFNHEGVASETERAAPKATRAGRKPKPPAEEPEEAMHVTPESVAEEAKEAAELVGLQPYTAGGPQNTETPPQPDATAAESPAEPEEAASSASDGGTETEAGSEATTEGTGLEASENEAMQAPIGNADLPKDLTDLITATETVETWADFKQALGVFQKTGLWPTLSADQQNHIRASAWDSLVDRAVRWAPNPAHDVSAFRLYIEAEENPDQIRATLALLKADPEYQAKSASMREQVEGAATARLADLER